MKKEKDTFLASLLAIFLLSLAMFLIPSLLTFITTNQVSTSNSLTPSLPEGWGQYLFVIAIIYLLIALLLTSLVIFHPSSDTEEDANPLVGTSAWIYLVALAILIIVPTYALGVYPNLPQQIGGGKLLRVEAVVSSDQLKPYFTNDSIETYLIDRTSNSALFLLLNKDKQNPRIIEVATNLIQSITYNFPP